MAGIRNCEFRREAVRIALISGLAGHQVELDPGAGLSTIGIWILVISEVKEVLNGKPIFSGKLDGCKETRILRRKQRNCGQTVKRPNDSGAQLLTNRPANKVAEISSGHASSNKGAGL